MWSCDYNCAIDDGGQVAARRVTSNALDENSCVARCNRQMLVCSAGRTVHNKHVNILQTSSICVMAGDKKHQVQDHTSPQSTSFRNCLMRPFFFGPRQITLEANGSHRHLCHVTGFCRTAALGSSSKKPTLTTAMFSTCLTCYPTKAHSKESIVKAGLITGYTGIQPKGDCWMVDDATPMRCGTEGPQMSMSRSPI